MFDLDTFEIMFVASAILFQIILILHFALRKWHFAFAMRYGWIVYALSLPAAGISGWLLLGGKPWSLWLGGFVYLVWASFGYTVEYTKGIQWRYPIRWSIYGPYVFLYLATVMFYWWPLGLLSRSLWYLGALLFITSTILNVASHKESQDDGEVV